MEYFFLLVQNSIINRMAEVRVKGVADVWEVSERGRTCKKGGNHYPGPFEI